VTSYFEADGLGSVTSLSSTAGALANTYTYDSFGNTTNSTGSITNPFRYTGREFDSETGLYYYRARYYDPTSGRFLSEDPIHFIGGVNFYRYVRNKPPNFRDALGLCPDTCRTEAIEMAAAGVALDAIGLVPGGEAVAAAASDAAALSQGFDFAANLGSIALTVSEGDGTGAGFAITGTAITIGEVAKGASGFIPVLGQIVAGVSVIWDIYHGVEKYMKCDSGGGD